MHAASLADMMLGMLGEVLAGREAAVDDALAVRSALLQRQDIYVPLDVQGQFLAAGSNLDVSDCRCPLPHSRHSALHGRHALGGAACVLAPSHMNI